MRLPLLNYKKIALIVLFLLTTVFFAWLIYLFFLKPAVIPSNNNANLTSDEDQENQYSKNFNRYGSLPKENTNKTVVPKNKNSASEKKLPKIKKIVNDGIKGAQISATDNKIVYYNRDDGKFYKIEGDGKPAPLSEKIFPNAQKIVWSPDKNKVILEFPDGSNIVYNFLSDTQTTLPAHWEEFEFSSNNQKIAVKNFGSSPEDNNLIIADLKNGQAKIIENLGDKPNNFQINWSPDNQIVAFFTENIDFDHQEVYFVGQHGENFKSIIVNGLGFEGKWSPNGDMILYSVSNSENGYKPVLWITNKSGTYKKKLGINTWAEKCSFYDNNIIYCGVPKRLEEMMGLNINYALDIDDDIYRIDIIKNFTEKVASLKNHNIKNILVDRHEKTLYFTDRRTGRLYKIDLVQNP